MILRKGINYIIGSGHLRYYESWSKDIFLYLEDGFLIGGQVFMARGQETMLKGQALMAGGLMEV
jgi:hypothetical protein